MTCEPARLGLTEGNVSAPDEFVEARPVISDTADGRRDDQLGGTASLDADRLTDDIDQSVGDVVEWDLRLRRADQH
jgi:hypothetical protein